MAIKVVDLDSETCVHCVLHEVFGPMLASLMKTEGYKLNTAKLCKEVLIFAAEFIGTAAGRNLPSILPTLKKMLEDIAVESATDAIEAACDKQNAKNS